MKTVIIPQTELLSSSIVLGTALYGKTIDKESSYRLMDTYIDLGGNHIDTARVYSNWIPGELHSSEKTIGRWMKERGNRNHVLLATKGAHPSLESGSSFRLTRADIRSDLQGSLKDLQTDWIDLYWLHRDHPAIPVEEVMESLAEIVREGFVRAVGVSNWRPERILAANQFARQKGIPALVGNQLMWSLAKPVASEITDNTVVFMDDASMDMHEQTGMAAFAYSSQAKGFFSGKYQRGMLDAPQSSSSESVRRMYGTDANFELLERVAAKAAEIGCTTNQVALAYLMRPRSFPTFPIIGPRTTDQLKESMGAADLIIDAL